MPTMRDRIEKLVERYLDKVRNEPNLDELVAAGLQLGVGTHIGHPLYIDRLHPWLITIDDYAQISPFAQIITHDPTLAQYTAQTRIGRVHIGKRVNVGSGAIILPGTIIGDDSVIGAGAVVHGEIPPESIAIGNPAKISPIKGVVAWHKATARRAPSWPREGSSRATGATEDVKRAQQEALADGSSGFVPATPAPGSPYALRAGRNSQRA